MVRCMVMIAPNPCLPSPIVIGWRLIRINNGCRYAPHDAAIVLARWRDCALGAHPDPTMNPPPSSLDPREFIATLPALGLLPRRGARKRVVSGNRVSITHALGGSRH